jgi:hypothetical protein
MTAQIASFADITDFATLMERAQAPARSAAAFVRRSRAARMLAVRLGPDPLPEIERAIRLSIPVGRPRAGYYDGRSTFVTPRTEFHAIVQQLDEEQTPDVIYE